MIDDEACSSAPKVGVSMGSYGPRWCSQWRVDGVCGICTSGTICEHLLGASRGTTTRVYDRSRRKCTLGRQCLAQDALTKAGSPRRLPRAGREDQQMGLKTSQVK